MKLLFLFSSISFCYFCCLWTNYNPTDLKNSGFISFIITTILLIFLSLVIVIPLVYIVSLSLYCYIEKKWIKEIILTILNAFNSLPSILFSVFGFVVFVVTFRIGDTGFSIFAASLSLFFIIFPYMVISCYDAYCNIPINIYYNALALGITKWQAFNKIIFRRIKISFLIIIFFTISRIISETAPVIFVLGSSFYIPQNFFSQGSTISTAIYLLLTTSTDPYAHNFVYSLSFLTIFILFIINLLIKLINYHQKKIHTFV